jgi:hypothetical protein
MRRPRSCRKWVVLFLLLALPLAGQEGRPARAVVQVPQVDSPPRFEDFLSMQPEPEAVRGMARVEGFIQREPHDGHAPSQETVVYLGYDHEHFYAVFLAYDLEPEKIRARLSRREDVFGDDHVHIMLDTFHDQRRAYSFICNPLGIQWDAIWTEGAGSNFDSSFDTVWHSRGRVTERGYVVWMAIPFKSLRFTPGPQQTWGIVLNRGIPRSNENLFWPHVSDKIEGRMNQAGRLEGLSGISPGRNIQLIPYGLFRSFRALDLREPTAPVFAHKRIEGDIGLDAKFILRDSVVLDFTVNPDFSQVESDEPQVTVNQRFEVFFPEKRPFFLENAGYFATPINLLFTRRIADPQFGGRMTTKTGPYAIGLLFADDQSPGRSVPVGHPREGTRAYFGVARVSRDILKQSHVGGMYTHREYQGSSNRVGGADGRFKIGDNWSVTWQGVGSHTRQLNGAEVSGAAGYAGVRHSGRHFNLAADHLDISPGFRTQPGFVNRVDLRNPSAFATYRFRPVGKPLIAWGPSASGGVVWDHSGLRLDSRLNTDVQWHFRRQNTFAVFHSARRERLRPQDFLGLPAARDYSSSSGGFWFRSQHWQQVSLSGDYEFGTRLNFVPAPGQEPEVASWARAFTTVGLRPVSPLRIDTTHIWDRLGHRPGGQSVFNNHIVRTKVNWQFNRELSVRAIVEYHALLANPANTLLETTRNLNFDFLITYLVHPGTALHVGYNSNLQNLHPGLCPRLPGSMQCDPLGSGPRRTPTGFINDGRQFFVKMSYLYRF